MEERITLMSAIALVGILPITGALFLLFPPRVAVALAYLVGWLFLPQASIDIPGALPNWDRVHSLALSALVAVIVLDGSRLLRLRPKLLDLPILAYCLVIPVASAVLNGLGFYDGISQSVGTTLGFGVPYLIGRLYFGDEQGLRNLALVVFVAGLIYIPFCLWEVRFSPQLHRNIYGFHQHSFGQTYRLGGWRPVVFLQHGLAVGMLMTCASLMGMWLWTTKQLGRWHTEGAVALCVLILTTFLCKSFGSLVLLALGMAALLACRYLGSRALIIALALVPPVYMSARLSGSWAADGVTQAVATVAPDRAASLAFRIHNENLLIAKGLEQPILGWGGWNRGRVEDETRGGKMVVTDGMWIISFNRQGLVGLSVLTALFLLPSVLLVLRGVRNQGGDAVAIGLAVMLAVYMIDNLANAMFTPFNPLAMGGLFGWLARPREPGVGAFEQRALRLWGQVEVRRREQIALHAARALPPREARVYAFRYRAVLLALHPAQVEAFLREPPEAQRAWADRCLGIAPVEAAAAGVSP